MANHVGNEGQIKVGSNAIGEVRGFEITEEVNVEDDTVMGDDWETHKTKHKKWNGSANILWDESDTQGQVACVVGASITLGVYPEGSTSGDTFLSGTATVTKRTITSNYNGLVEMAIDFLGNGALATSTVPV